MLKKNLHVQYGCGWTAPQTWMNFDASPTIRFERIPVLGRMFTKNEQRFPENIMYGDIVNGLPLPEGSCAAIYASHVLEHLALEDFRVALKNTLALLQSGGIFRLVVPDLKASAQAYLASGDATAAHKFMEETSLGHHSRARGVGGLVKSWLGNSAHLWMWDEPSLVLELENAGFVSIRRCECGDSSDILFRDVENPGRFENAVAMEALRSVQERPGT